MVAQKYGIPLTQGEFVYVDAADFEKVSQYKWYYNSAGYAVRDIHKAGKKKTILMHRVLNRTPKDMETDHINGDKLDNSKSNLRTVTHKQNLRNQRPQKGRSSIYKGVCWHKQRQKWCARIYFNGRHISLGLHISEETAGKAYDKAAKEHFGEFAKTNF